MVNGSTPSLNCSSVVSFMDKSNRIKAETAIKLPPPLPPRRISPIHQSDQTSSHSYLIDLNHSTTSSVSTTSASSSFSIIPIKPQSSRSNGKCNRTESSKATLKLSPDTFQTLLEPFHQSTVNPATKQGPCLQPNINQPRDDDNLLSNVKAFELLDLIG